MEIRIGETILTDEQIQAIEPIMAKHAKRANTLVTETSEQWWWKRHGRIKFIQEIKQKLNLP